MRLTPAPRTFDLNGSTFETTWYPPFEIQTQDDPNIYISGRGEAESCVKRVSVRL